MVGEGGKMKVRAEGQDRLARCRQRLALGLRVRSRLGAVVEPMLRLSPALASNLHPPLGRIAQDVLLDADAAPKSAASPDGPAGV